MRILMNYQRKICIIYIFLLQSTIEFIIYVFNAVSYLFNIFLFYFFHCRWIIIEIVQDF